MHQTATSPTTEPANATGTSARMEGASASAVRLGDLVIRGLTRQGRSFRPSDWAERLCGVMSAFGPDEQLRYSPLVAPAFIDGQRCVIIRKELAELEPRLYRFFLGFAVDNELQIGFDADAVASLLPETVQRLARDEPLPTLVRDDY